MGMLDRESRQVRAKVIPNVKRETLQNAILNEIEQGSTVYTDGGDGYTIWPSDYIHETVNHVEEYVRGEVHTQGIENFWSLLKRSLKGTYVAVEPSSECLRRGAGFQLQQSCDKRQSAE